MRARTASKCAIKQRTIGRYIFPRVNGLITNSLGRDVYSHRITPRTTSYYARDFEQTSTKSYGTMKWTGFQSSCIKLLLCSVGSDLLSLHNISVVSIALIYGLWNNPPFLGKRTQSVQPAKLLQSVPDGPSAAEHWRAEGHGRVLHRPGLQAGGNDAGVKEARQNTVLWRAE